MLALNRELAQSLLTQTNSIDESARLMCEQKDIHSFYYWRKEISKLVESGELII